MIPIFNANLYRHEPPLWIMTNYQKCTADVLYNVADDSTLSKIEKLAKNAIKYIMYSIELIISAVVYRMLSEKDKLKCDIIYSFQVNHTQETFERVLEKLANLNT